MLSATKSRTLVAMEIVGTLFIIFLGSALHFTFDLSGGNSAVALVSATNESVWEHLKLAFWPSLFWMLITIAPFRSKVNNFFAAKTAGATFMIIFIPVVFYTYTAFTGKSIFAVDISTFVVAIILGQIITNKLFKSKCVPTWTEKIGMPVMVVLAVAFLIFTFYPPHLGIFQDPVTGNYGIRSA